MPLTVQWGRFHWSATGSMTLLTIIAVGMFISLGRWQWHRADEKRTLAAQFSGARRAPTDLDQRSTAALPRYSHVRVLGRYDSRHQFLLDNRSYRGSPGYEVLTPFTFGDGRAILVNRGWVPLTRSRQQLPDIALPERGAPGAVVGLLDNLPVAALSMGHVPPAAAGSWPKLTSFPTAADLSAALGRPLESRQLLLDADQPVGYLRDWHPTGLGPLQHLSYALQWWAFAALALVLYGALNRRRPMPS